MKQSANNGEYNANLLLVLFALGFTSTAIYTALVFHPVLFIIPLIMSAITLVILCTAVFYLITRANAESQIVTNNTTIDTNQQQIASELQCQEELSELNTEKEKIERELKQLDVEIVKCCDMKGGALGTLVIQQEQSKSVTSSHSTLFSQQTTPQNTTTTSSSVAATFK